VAKLEAIVGELPHTQAVISGPGDGGCHLFFWRPGDPETRDWRPVTEARLNKVIPGVDIKTSHGYTILPPSLHPDTHCPYEWRGDGMDQLIDPLPAKLEALITAPPPRPPGTHRPPTSGALQGIVRRVAREATTRNKVLYWGAMRLVEGDYPERAYDARRRGNKGRRRTRQQDDQLSKKGADMTSGKKTTRPLTKAGLPQALRRLIGQREAKRILEEMDAAAERELHPDGRWMALDEYLDGSYVAPTATIGAPRVDDVQFFYPGKWHTLIGLTTAGKTFFALWQAKHVMEMGEHVIYVHFEEYSPAGTIHRLLQMVLTRRCSANSSAGPNHDHGHAAK
jgi:hypothetical protein